MNKAIIFFFLLISFFGYAQKAKKSAKDDGGFSKELKNAELYFNSDDYLNALTIYNTILSKNPSHEKSNLQAAVCKIKLNYPIDDAKQNLEKLKKSNLPEVLFYYGRFYHLTNNFDEALVYFNKYKALPEKKREFNNTTINYYTAMCNNAKDNMLNPHRAIVKNLGPEVNTKYDEFMPLLTADESVLYFTSNRENTTGDSKDSYGNYYEDIYLSMKNNDKWIQAVNIGSPINSSGHDACVALKSDGQEMIIYRAEKNAPQGDLYSISTTIDGWSYPQKLGSEINSQYTESGVCFNNDTTELYFSSNRPGGYGGKDIYRIKKLPNAKWSLPYNLGPVINTTYDEDAPFLSPDGVTLYFSSKGHNTMGDYDIYKTVFNAETNKYNVPENLGYPINTVNNDIYFVLSASGKHGYYSSVKEDSYGASDIYMIDTRFGDNDFKVKIGYMYKEKVPIKTKITLIDIESKQVTGIYTSNPKTGRFILILNPYKAYKGIIEEPGCHSMVIDVDPFVRDNFDGDLILTLTPKNK